MDNDFHRLGHELIRFLDEFPPSVAAERYPSILKLVIDTLDTAMRADPNCRLPDRPRPGREDTH